jgi:hypothetical protein
MHGMGKVIFNATRYAGIGKNVQKSHAQRGFAQRRFDCTRLKLNVRGKMLPNVQKV